MHFFEKLCLINLQIRKFCCIFALVLGAKNKEPRIKTYYLRSLQRNNLNLLNGVCTDWKCIGIVTATNSAVIVRLLCGNSAVRGGKLKGENGKRKTERNMAPVEEVRGKICMNRGNDSVMVTRRKCYGKTKNGTPRLGPKEMYTYHLHKGKWSAGVEANRELFKVAQKQAIAEMNNPERLIYWQTLFEQQLDHPQQGEKQYVKLQCYIAAQLLKALKAG